jgi:hypoxanthine phosphoribosyltransferase
VLDYFYSFSYITNRRKLFMGAKSEPLVITGNYFPSFYDDNLFLTNAKRILKNVDYDTMVGIGLSGVLAVCKLSTAFHKYGLYIRKGGETAHSSWPQEGFIGSKWIFVDDLISTGSTFKVAYERVRDLIRIRDHKSKFMGAYLYEHRTFRTVKSLEEVFERKCIEK